MVRFKNRYLLCELKWEDGKFDPLLKSKDIYDAVRESVGINFGDHGTGLVLSSLSSNFLVGQILEPSYKSFNNKNRER